MPEKYDPDTSPGVKLLRVFRKLLLNDHKHYQSDLAKELNCSPQTVIRIMKDIEQVIGINLETGTDERRRWYRIVSNTPMTLGMKAEELRYLSVCRDLAVSSLPAEVINRVDDTIFNLSMRLSEQKEEHPGGRHIIRFFNKGRIDYRGFFPILQKMFDAIEKEQVCHILYKAPGNKKARWHYFIPHKLACMNEVLYFSGAIMQDNLTFAEHYVTLALHRIREFIFIDHFAHLDFCRLDTDAFGIPWHEPLTSRVHFRPGRASEYVAERIWSIPQRLEWQKDGSLVLELIINSKPELRAWVRSFGDEVLDYQEEYKDLDYLLSAYEDGKDGF